MSRAFLQTGHGPQRRDCLAGAAGFEPLHLEFAFAGFSAVVPCGQGRWWPDLLGLRRTICCHSLRRRIVVGPDRACFLMRKFEFCRLSPAQFISGMGCAVRGYVAESGTSSDYAVSEFLRAVGGQPPGEAINPATVCRSWSGGLA